MESLKASVARYRQISLADLDRVQLMNRTDTKFVLSKRALLEVLDEIRDAYQALQVEGLNLSRYATLYFDTPRFEMYRLHHNGKKNRKKVRMRSYVDSNLSFLEVKHKDNKGRTVKKRVVIPQIDRELTPENRESLELFEVPYHDLEAKVMNRFERITLANNDFSERVTIDTGMDFDYQGKKASFPELVIIEVKQGNFDRYSVIMDALKKRLIRPSSMSKYCLGVASLLKGENDSTNSRIKTNNFKPNLRLVKKIA